MRVTGNTLPHQQTLRVSLKSRTPTGPLGRTFVSTAERCADAMPESPSTMVLTDADLPGTWKNADDESKRGQRLTLWLTGGKVGGGLLAAFGGAVSWHVHQIDVSAWIILVGFLVALICELTSWKTECERTWYEGRAVAESVKTLAWRYAVGADPFPFSLDQDIAITLLRKRISSITQEVSGRIIFDADDALTTPKMDNLRCRTFTERRDAYILGRTGDQKIWYATKARTNRHKARVWRIILLISELLALILAAGRVFGEWEMEFAGLLAALIAAGTAWISVKQFSSLATAYAVATKELGLQESKLRTVRSEDWPLVAADAEEAISREHTTWLASRTGQFPNWQGT